MSSIIWINNKTASHTYGIELMTTCRSTAEAFMYTELIPLCKELNCPYFVQGLDLNEHRSSWVFIEFFGASDNKALETILEFEKRFCNSDIFFENKLFNEEPSTELLKSLGLM